MKMISFWTTYLGFYVFSCLILSHARPDEENDYWKAPHPSLSKMGVYKNAAIATESATCAPIAKEILLKGGSAVDAAITLLLCIGVIDPEASGLGGGFHMLYYNKEENKAYHFDAKEVAPANASKDMFHGNRHASQAGGLPIAVPGALAGYELLHSRFGKLKWRDVFQPVIKMTMEGFKVSPHLGDTLIWNGDEVREFDDIRKLFTNPLTGEFYKTGETMFRPDLARTFAIIAEEGKRAIYGPSELAEEFLTDLKNAGSIIERSDMMTYHAKIREPVKISLRNNMTLYTTNMPAGGPLVALIMNIMNGYSDINPDVVSSREKTVTTLHRLLEAFKFAYANRQYFEDDDSLEMEQFVKDLTSKKYADKVRSLIDDNSIYEADPTVIISEDHGTSHNTVVAPNGDVVTVTQSINLRYGSKVVSPSTGIILNDQMGDFDSPNITSYFLVPPGKKNFIRPGKRPLSSMAPTIILDSNNNIRLVIGASGGTRIPSHATQVILKHLWLEKNIKDAIDSPRLHYQYHPDRVEAEKGFNKDIIEDLRSLGHNIPDLPWVINGNVNAVARVNGQITANTDYRTSGGVDGF